MAEEERALRERILAYGATGTGKSYAWLTIAGANPDKQFHCLDTDEAILRMLKTEFCNLKNVSVYPARQWSQCESVLSQISLFIEAQDWFVIDMLDSLWDFVQSYYTTEIFGKKLDDYFLEVRKHFKGGSKLEAFKGWTDWVVINKLYQDWINRAMYELPCNIFATAKATKLETTDDMIITDMFSAIGMKPEGEKRNAYRVHTVLLFTHNAFGYYMSTVKDRGRLQVLDYPINNFARQYFSNDFGKESNASEIGNRQTSNITEAAKAFGKFLSEKHVPVSKALAILGVKSLAEIADYKQAYEIIKEELGK